MTTAETPTPSVPSVADRTPLWSSISRRLLLRSGTIGLLSLAGVSVGADALAVPLAPTAQPAPPGRPVPVPGRPGRPGSADAIEGLDFGAGAFAALEQRHQVRLGIAAFDTATGRRLHHRGAERFPIMSVFKVLAVSCLLRDHDCRGHILDQTVRVRAVDLVANSPITSGYVGQRLSYAGLCDAALRYSDNTAGNLILRRIGGPSAIAPFARSLGDFQTRLDRTEPTLNTAIPGDPRDTTTPADLSRDLGRLLLGRALAVSDRNTLIEWMLHNTTSAKRFRAVLPAGWSLTDKTGSGDYGSANDVGVFFRPNGSAVVLSALSTKADADADYDDAVLAEAAQIVLATFERQ